jgi:hypothetical protein
MQPSGVSGRGKDFRYSEHAATVALELTLLTFPLDGQVESASDDVDIANG